MKVFLGGTCNESNWRNRIIPMLEVGFFNPVVDDWTPDCMAEELRQREECDVCLYVITPKMTGVYSVAEVIDDSNKRPARTVFVRLRDDGDEKFTDGQWKSLGAVAQMVERNGGTAFDSLKSAALHINALTPNAELAQAAKAEGWTKLPGQLPEPGMPEPPGIQALMCVISSLRDIAHFSDEEGGELMSALCALRDWAYAQTAQAEGWRTIETAPKGELVLLWSEITRGEPFIGDWAEYARYNYPQFTHWSRWDGLPPTSAKGVEHG